MSAPFPGCSSASVPTVGRRLGLCFFAAKSWISGDDHALVCACSGDRVVRHNAVRNVVFQAAFEASCVDPVHEKPSPPAPEVHRGSGLVTRPGTA